MSLEPWKTIGSETLFEVPGRIRVEVETVMLPDGRVVNDYLQVRMRSFAVVFAEATDGKVVCLNQYKHGPQRVSLTLPAGQIEDAETPLDAARRELLEETGFAGKDYRLLGSLVVSGNQGCGMAHVVCARACSQVAQPTVSDLEDMEITFVTRDALREALMTGKVAIVSHAAAIGMGLLFSDPCLAPPQQSRD